VASHSDGEGEFGEGRREPVARVEVGGEFVVAAAEVLREVDHSVQVDSPVADLDVGFVDEPPIGRSVPAGPGRVAHQWSEPLHPAVDRDMGHSAVTVARALLSDPLTRSGPQHPSAPVSQPVPVQRAAPGGAGHSVTANEAPLPTVPAPEVTSRNGSRP